MKVTPTKVDPEYCDYLTEGKEYEVIDTIGSAYVIKDDSNYSTVICIGERCEHLGGGYWKVIEE